MRQFAIIGTIIVLLANTALARQPAPRRGIEARPEREATFPRGLRRTGWQPVLARIHGRGAHLSLGCHLASHPSRSGAQQQATRLNRSLRPILQGKRIGYVRKRLTGSARTVYTAQVSYDSRAEANAFCIKLKQLGGRCIVLKN